MPLDDFGDSFGRPWHPSQDQNLYITITKLWFFMKSLVCSKTTVLSIFYFLGGPSTDFSIFLGMQHTLRTLWGAWGNCLLGKYQIYHQLLYVVDDVDLFLLFLIEITKIKTN